MKIGQVWKRKFITFDIVIIYVVEKKTKKNQRELLARMNSYQAIYTWGGQYKEKAITDYY